MTRFTLLIAVIAPISCHAQVAQSAVPLPLAIAPASAPEPLAPVLVPETMSSARHPDAAPIDLVFAAPDGWQQLFPIILVEPRPSVETTRCGATRPVNATAYFDLTWLTHCLEAVPYPNSSNLRVVSTPAELRAAVERANRALFENGYVNSGVLVDNAHSTSTHMRLELVVGALVAEVGGHEVKCALSPPSGDEDPQHRYVQRRLMRGCDVGRPFNVYALERDFRRLADDQQTTVDRLDLRLEPVCGQAGRALLVPAATDARGCTTFGGAANGASGRLRPAANGARIVHRLPFIEMVAGFANARSPSIGSDRGFAALALRPLAGVLFDGEAGLTAGALDGSAALTLEAAPRWTVRLRADANDAEVIDPALRPLGIRSQGWGAEAAIVYGAVHCPPTPLFGDGQTGLARLAYLWDGIERCRVGARMAGDSPVGWSAGRDVSASLIVSHRTSTSYLLGLPFSFAPGAVDGRSNVTAVRGAIDWLERGRAGGGGERGWTLAARLLLSQGIGGSATDIAGLNAPSPRFTSLQVQFGYARELSFAGLVFTARLRAQIANEILYTAERFAIGGADSVRGFAEASLLADRGISGSLELNRVISLDRNRSSDGLAGSDPFRFRLGIFVDAGRGTTIAPGANASTNLASSGVSAAWIPTDWLELRADYAVHLSPKLPFAGDSLVERGVHFALTIRPLKLLGWDRN